jgi:hypothetical protein
MIFGAMHFDQENWTLFTKHLPSALKNRDFRSLDIAFNEIGSGVRGNKLVERYSVDRYIASSRILC